jgi:hypothetical protein
MRGGWIYRTFLEKSSKLCSGIGFPNRHGNSPSLSMKWFGLSSYLH